MISFKLDWFLVVYSGSNEDRGMMYKVAADSTDDTVVEPPMRVATFTDIKIMYGTLPGYVSFRSPDDGSHYITVLCEIWAAHAFEANIDELLKLTDNELQAIAFDRVQVSSTVDRGFGKALYFNPGCVKAAWKVGEPNTK